MLCKTNENNQLFLSFLVIADRQRKELLITQETAQHLNDICRFSTGMYFRFKKKYPNLKEVHLCNFLNTPDQKSNRTFSKMILYIYRHNRTHSKVPKDNR